MRYVSLFSGVEAATLAWEQLGWEPVAFCEVDEFPSAVLAERWPEVSNLGDICKVDWGKFKEEHGAVDIVVGGSPCQAFSIAGGRGGLLDQRGQLVYEYVRAIDSLRPTWLVWENVCGALSDRSDAFGCLLRALQECGYRDLAWRVCDSQFWGIPQRRRRVFLVGHLGGGGRSAAVLFEPSCLRGNPQTSKEKRQELTRAIEQRADGTSGRGGGLARCFAQNSQNEVRYNNGDGQITGVLAASKDGKGQGVPMVMASRQANAEILTDCAPTLLAAHERPIVCMGDDNGKAAVDVDIAGTLKVGGAQPIVAAPTDRTS